MKKTILSLFALLLLSNPIPRVVFAQSPKNHGPYAAGGKPFVLAEFYNSENCLHCRKPTEVMRELADRAVEDSERIFVLSYEVDYLGIDDWKDIYESSKFSDRQRRYNTELRQRLVLPGQVIINGQFPALAEYSDYVDQAVTRMLETRSKAVLQLHAKYVPESRYVSIDYTVEGLRDVRREFFYLQVAVAQDGIVRKITKGPNAGYTFHHSNIVRAFETSRFSKEWKGRAEVVVPDDVPTKNTSIVCFIEDPITLKIYAAERLYLKDIEEIPERH